MNHHLRLLLSVVGKSVNSVVVCFCCWCLEGPFYFSTTIIIKTKFSLNDDDDGVVATTKNNIYRAKKQKTKIGIKPSLSDRNICEILKI